MIEPAAGDRPPFSPLMVATLIGVGLAAFGAFLLLIAYPPDLGADRRGGGSALSVSAVGFAGLIDLLRSQDVPVAVSRTADTTAKPATLVLTPPPARAAAVRARLADARATLLVVLPKWTTTPDPDHPGWALLGGLVDAPAVTATLPAGAVLSRRADRTAAVLHGGSGLFAGQTALPLAPIDRLQTIGVSADWTPLLLDEAGGVVLARWTRAARPAVLVLTDPDLMDTQGLKTLAGARAALAILDGLRDGGPLTFDVTLNGLGHSRNLLQLLFEPPLLGATVCALAGGLLILAMAAHRFGPPLRPPRVLDFGKRALADNSAGLIALAGREPGMAAPYARLLRARVIRDIGAPPRLDGPALALYLDEVAAARGLADTATSLETATSAVTDRATLVAVARRWHDWSQGMRRGRR